MVAEFIPKRLNSVRSSGNRDAGTFILTRENIYFAFLSSGKKCFSSSIYLCTVNQPDWATILRVIWFGRNINESFVVNGLVVSVEDTKFFDDVGNIQTPPGIGLPSLSVAGGFRTANHKAARGLRVQSKSRVGNP